jgi:hypothetical protein
VLFQQPVKLCFSNKGKSTPFGELLHKFKVIIESNPMPAIKASSPKTLKHSIVGKMVEHRFFVKEKQEDSWFTGTVQEYDEKSDTYEVLYDNEDEPCHFSLEVDYALGDLKVIEGL